jgi:hypothetical protein
LFLKNKFKKYSSVSSQKPLVIIDLGNDTGKRLYNIKTIEELQKIQHPKFQNTYENYKLVGVVQGHNYNLSTEKFYPLKEKIKNIFFRLPSGRFFIEEYNPTWRKHFDAYVNYNNSWYLMDDEARWKASSGKEQNPDVVAKALIHCYPGMPTMLIYAPTKASTHNSDTINSDTVKSEKYSLTLKRDTKKPSLVKSALILLGGALCDGILVGGPVFLVGCASDYAYDKQLPTKQTIKISSIVGLITGCLSIAYHGRRILSMHKSQVTYDSQSPHKDLGVREK